MDSSRVKMRGFVVQQEAPAPQDAAPQAWLVNRRVIDEETNQPVMEGIFSNYNDDIIIEADEMTLVGRYDPARGPAQRLAIGDRLYVEDGAPAPKALPVLKAPAAHRRRCSCIASTAVRRLPIPVRGGIATTTQ